MFKYTIRYTISNICNCVQIKLEKAMEQESKKSPNSAYFSYAFYLKVLFLVTCNIISSKILLACPSSEADTQEITFLWLVNISKQTQHSSLFAQCWSTF